MSEPLTPERRAEIDAILQATRVQNDCDSPFEWRLLQALQDSVAEIDRLTAENAACADDVRNMVASLDAESREIDRLNKVVDQAIYAGSITLDGNEITTRHISIGLPELAAELQRRGK